MRELNECKAEVFRRSEERIRERRKKRNRALAVCIPLCLAVAALAAINPLVPRVTKNNSSGDLANENVNVSAEIEENFYNKLETEKFGSIESFSFSFTWGCYGLSSYNSNTGKLVKTKDSTHPDDYITTYILTDEQKRRIYEAIKELDVVSYPDVYDPHEGGAAARPSMTLVLTVNTDTIQKTIAAEDIALTYVTDNADGQKFLDVCKSIRDILMETEEWKALPEYKFFYD